MSYWNAQIYISPLEKKKPKRKHEISCPQKIMIMQ